MKKKKLLSFDISSSTIGYSILEIDKTKISYIKTGYIKPLKSESILENLAYARAEVLNILHSQKFDYIAIEDLVKFMPKTTSTTVTVLASFNRMIGLIAYDYLNGYYNDISRLFLIAPISIRHSIKKLAALKDLPDKKMLPNIISKLLNFTFPWEYELTKRKKQKIKEENFDMSDAICCGYVAATRIVELNKTTAPTKTVKKNRTRKMVTN